MIAEVSANSTKHLKYNRGAKGDVRDACTRITMWAESGEEAFFLRELFNAFKDGTIKTIPKGKRNASATYGHLDPYRTRK